jgi:transposase-like protein
MDYIGQYSINLVCVSQAQTIDINPKKECPRCQQDNIFIIDKLRKTYWCKDCCMSFERHPRFEK